MEHLARAMAVRDLNPETQLKWKLNNLFPELLQRALKGEVTDHDQTSHINDLYRDVWVLVSGERLLWVLNCTSGEGWRQSWG